MPPEYEKPSNAKEGIFARDNSALVSTFNTIASLYGDEEALNMVKITPGVLAFNKDNFAPCLAFFAEKFGAEEAKEMVQCYLLVGEAWVIHDSIVSGKLLTGRSNLVWKRHEQWISRNRISRFHRMIQANVDYYSSCCL